MSDCNDFVSSEPLLVDAKLLPDKLVHDEPMIKYTINGESFHIQNESNDDYFQFFIESMHKKKKDEKTDANILSYDIQETPIGFIINYDIFLSKNNWNTITLIEKNLFWCFVCSNIVLDINEHIETEAHKRNMKINEPLEKFDLCIVRLMSEWYHCGVCNDIINAQKREDHFKSENHENNLASAYHKCLYYNDLDKLDESEVPSDPIAPSFTHSPTDYAENVCCGTSESGIVDLSVSDVFGNVESNPKEPNYRISYATVAATASKKYTISWFGTKYNINIDSWNMIIELKCEYYCMSCKATDVLQRKREHCQEATHIMNLRRCPPLHEHKEYIIRKVDDKFVHCANCNNLLLIDSIDDHIERIHNKKKKSMANKTEDKEAIQKKNTTQNCSKNDDSGNNITQTTNECNVTEIVKNNGNNVTDNFNAYNTAENNIIKVIELHKKISTEREIIYDKISLHLYGYNMRVSLLSYNIVTCSPDGIYYCHLCNERYSKENILYHINENVHRLQLQRPYLPTLGVNLIRMLNFNSGLHCTHCHLILPNNVLILNNHILEPFHLTNLNTALGFVENIQMNPAHRNYEVIEQKEAENVNKRHGGREEKTNKNSAPEEVIEKTEIQSEFKAKQESSNGDEAKQSQSDPTKALFTEITNRAKAELEKSNTYSEFCNQKPYKDRINVMFSEEIILAKFKSKCIKISFSSYNTFVSLGNGCWYCFVCYMERLCVDDHFTIDNHLKNLKKFSFIDKYDNNLIRQNGQVYHCAICNVIITSKKDIQTHITWIEHINNLAAKTRNRSRAFKKHKVFEIILTKEIQQDDFDENAKIVAKHKFETVNPASVAKKNKIITHAGNTFKLTWDAWQGVLRKKNAYLCRLCKMELKMYDLAAHVVSTSHTKCLGKFERKYLPELIRMIDESTLNCLTCNGIVSNKEHIILNHIKGKSHKKCLQDTLLGSNENFEDDDILIIN